MNCPMRIKYIEKLSLNFHVKKVVYELSNENPVYIMYNLRARFCLNVYDFGIIRRGMMRRTKFSKDFDNRM